MRKAVVLFSGGVDSLSALVWATKRYGKENVLALYIDLGHRYSHKEIKAVVDICESLQVSHKIVPAVFVGKREREDAHIPWRNLFLIITACYFLPEEGGDIIIQNVQVGETSIGDRTLWFNQEVEELLKKVEQKDVRVIAPFANFTKGQIVRWLVDNGVDVELIKKTVGCFSSENDHCGECSACFRRWISLENAGLVKNINKEYKEWGFTKNPLKWEGVRKYAEKMLRGEYEDERVIETLVVLHKYGVIKGVIAVDLDETLCEATPWWNYTNAQPIKQNIEKVNRLYELGYGIWIYTSRFETDKKVTEEWLKKHGVKYHRLIMGKPWATHYIDDRAFRSLDEILIFEEEVVHCE